MPLSQADKDHLNKLFDIVGFEGEKGEGDEISESNPPIEAMDTSHLDTQSPVDTLDADILDLLDEPGSQSSNKGSVNGTKSELDDEDFGFLNEPEKKTSRESNQEKQQEIDDSPPIETHTMPETLSFNLEISDDQFATLEKIGELGPDADKEESSYLDEQENKSSRLMSRVRQEKDQEDTPVVNHTLPDNLIFNVSIAQDQLDLLLKKIGEESSTSKTGSESFLAEQENKNSRLMSRVKQATKEDDAPIVNHTLPDKLIFNTQLEDDKVKDLFKALGE